KLLERSRKITENLGADALREEPRAEEPEAPEPEEAPRDRLKRIKAALEWIKPDDQRTVLNVGLALRTTEDEAARELWIKWSGRPTEEWDTLVPATNRRVTPGFVYRMAQRAGWRYPMGHSGNRLEATVEQCERALIRGGAGIYRVGSALVHPVEVVVPA